MKGVVMCGGVGTRFRPLSFYLQKSMIPIGRREKPLLEYIIRLLKYHGFKDILLLADYKQEQIANYFEDGCRFGITISYLKDDPKLKGSLGALINAHKTGFIKRSDNFLVYYGDILSNINLRKLMQSHTEKRAAATLALTKEYPVAVGVAKVREGRVAGFVEKPNFGRPVSVGMLGLAGRVLEDDESSLRGQSSDLMGDFIPHLIKKGERIIPFLTDSFWYDVGSLEKYEKLSDDLLEKELGFLFQ